MLRLIKSGLQRLIQNPHRINENIYPSKMKAIVKTLEGGERMKISLKYTFKTGKVREFNFDRAVTEEVGKTLTRMTENINKETSKITRKLKKKQPETAEETPVKVHIMKNGSDISLSEPSGVAFTDETTLVIGDVQYEIELNTPNVLSLSLPQNMMAGFNVFPKVELEYSTLKDCSFTWYIATEVAENGCAEGASAPVDQVAQAEWQKIQDSYEFTPCNEHIGKKVKFSCTPRNSTKVGNVYELVSDCAITAPPGFCPYMTRHEFTKVPAEGFRAVSYNILADYYADTEFSRTQLFPYCPKYALDIDYRQQLFTSEIIGYNADIICLQECDKKVFEGHLKPILDIHDFGGVMKIKGTTAEGSAVFYRRSKFKQVASHGIQLSEYLKESPSVKDLFSKVSESKGLLERVINRSTCLQVVILQCVNDPSKQILVATTHLFWHPRGGHIRMIQTSVCLAYIEELLSIYSVNGKKPSLVFAGDFNSSPLCGNKYFISEGKVSPEHVDWMKGGEEEFVPNMDLKHSFKLISACGTPEFTNFNVDFQDCLDYIFINNEELYVKQVVPLPCREEMELYSAIPSVVCPSDHLALVCDLEWKENH